MFLQKCGAKLQYFSPLHDTSLPEDCDAMLLGGGYPELYAKELSKNVSMLNAIKKAFRAGMPTVAECGGCGSGYCEKEGYNHAKSTACRKI